LNQAHLTVGVLGPGGVGGFLAAVLAREGCSILVLAGDETAGAVAESGIRLESGKFGDFHVFVRAAVSLDEPVDVCLITVKATQLADAVSRVPADRLGQGLLVPFLNGLDHVDFLRGLYPASTVAAATIRIESTKSTPGLIRHTSPFAKVEIAASAENRERVEEFAHELRGAGVDVRVRDDELAMLWDKFSVLAPMALLSTHERAAVGTVRTKRRDELVGLIGEMAAVARSEGVDIDQRAVLDFVDAVPESMVPSMLRDQQAGRALELDALGVALLRRAAKACIQAPITERLVDDLQSRAPTTTR
jgi:2-dehydropantoate 2-reductase